MNSDQNRVPCRIGSLHNAKTYRETTHLTIDMSLNHTHSEPPRLVIIRQPRFLVLLHV